MKEFLDIIPCKKAIDIDPVGLVNSLIDWLSIVNLNVCDI